MNQPLENVAEFVSLGSNISTDGGAKKEVELRIWGLESVVWRTVFS